MRKCCGRSETSWVRITHVLQFDDKRLTLYDLSRLIRLNPFTKSSFWPRTIRQLEYDWKSVRIRKKLIHVTSFKCHFISRWRPRNTSKKKDSRSSWHIFTFDHGSRWTDRLTSDVGCVGSFGWSAYINQHLNILFRCRRMMGSSTFEHNYGFDMFAIIFMNTSVCTLHLHLQDSSQSNFCFTPDYRWVQSSASSFHVGAESDLQDVVRTVRICIPFASPSSSELAQLVQTEYRQASS